MPPKKQGAKKESKSKQVQEVHQEVPSQSNETQDQLPQVQQPVVQVQAEPLQNVIILIEHIQITQQNQEQQQPIVQKTQQLQQPSNIQTQGQSQRVITLASDQTKNQQGISSEVKVDAIKDLSLKEKMELRKQRFNALGNPNINTLDTIEKMKEEREKKIKRAEKFGVISKDLEEMKKQERAVKFGLVSASGITQQPMSKGETDEKKQSRAIRFGMANSELEEEKKKQRQERFGQTLDDIPGNRVVKRVKW